MFEFFPIGGFIYTTYTHKYIHCIQLH
ncbi:hypothetical protein BC937DRAFT_86253 [Endogone sp. FLAS-F59071]|nr:hypothetical protein BC937DRAFT_86253 [Endogone sp. FLAS-F59071]|eukprot:RUS13162.1 hypothetical protein BC937DRAFT_86253 [Endogone sp. FLAS-F59071]